MEKGINLKSDNPGGSPGAGGDEAESVTANGLRSGGGEGGDSGARTWG